jgi:hypothetical protein
MGMFAMTVEMPERDAARLHLTTPDHLVRLLDTRSVHAVVLMESGSTWNFAWTVPSLMLAGPRVARALQEALEREYDPTFRNELFIVYLPRGVGLSL